MSKKNKARPQVTDNPAPQTEPAIQPAVEQPTPVAPALETPPTPVEPEPAIQPATITKEMVTRGRVVTLPSGTIMETF
jgi:hypothetical protein